MLSNQEGTDSGWKFNKDRVDDRDDQTRTSEEICKSLNFVMNFLKFTTETEMDFTNNMLPTLDVQISVEEDGVMLYKHYTKPTSSGLLIQRNTALSDQIIFSSLRQDLMRRLKNTSLMLGNDEKVKLVEDYIIALVNSGHTYSYVKAVVQQSLAKYEYLVERSMKDPSDSFEARSNARPVGDEIEGERERDNERERKRGRERERERERSEREIRDKKIVFPKKLTIPDGN